MKTIMVYTLVVLFASQSAFAAKSLHPTHLALTPAEVGNSTYDYSKKVSSLKINNEDIAYDVIKISILAFMAYYFKYKIRPFQNEQVEEFKDWEESLRQNLSNSETELGKIAKDLNSLNPTDAENTAFKEKVAQTLALRQKQAKGNEIAYLDTLNQDIKSKLNNPGVPDTLPAYHAKPEKTEKEKTKVTKSTGEDEEVEEKPKITYDFFSSEAPLSFKPNDLRLASKEQLRDLEPTVEARLAKAKETITAIDQQMADPNLNKNEDQVQNGMDFAKAAVAQYDTYHNMLRGKLAKNHYTYSKYIRSATSAIFSAFFVAFPAWTFGFAEKSFIAKSFRRFFDKNLKLVKNRADSACRSVGALKSVGEDFKLIPVVLSATRLNLREEEFILDGSLLSSPDLEFPETQKRQFYAFDPPTVYCQFSSLNTETLEKLLEKDRLIEKD